MYNFKNHDKIYSSYSNIYSGCLWDFILLDELKFKRQKNDCSRLNNNPYNRDFSNNILNI